MQISVQRFSTCSFVVVEVPVKTPEKNSKDCMLRICNYVNFRYQVQDFDGRVLNSVSSQKAVRPVFTPLSSNFVSKKVSIFFLFTNPSWLNHGWTAVCNGHFAGAGGDHAEAGKAGIQEAKAERVLRGGGSGAVFHRGARVRGGSGGRSGSQGLQLADALGGRCQISVSLLSQILITLISCCECTSDTSSFLLQARVYLDWFTIIQHGSWFSCPAATWCALLLVAFTMR